MSYFRNLFIIYCAVIGLFGSVVWASIALAAPVPFYGWDCESVGGPAETRVIVFYEAGAYSIRVTSPESLMEFTDANLELKSGALLYVGSDGSQVAELSIADEATIGELGARRPGRLSMGENLDLSCYPTR